MKNPPRPTPEFRETKEYPDENWSFYYNSRCTRILANEWEAEMLFYELCRELPPNADLAMDPRSFLRRISDGRFPDTPFLALDEHEQAALVRKMGDPEGSVFQWVRRLSTRSIFQWTLNRWFKGPFTHRIEDAAYQAAAEEAEKWAGLTAEDFMPSTCPGSRAAAAEKNRLVSTTPGSDLYDGVRCTVTLHLDLEHHVDDIREEFDKVVELIKKARIPSNSPSENRGRGIDPHTRLRGLAAFRMKHHLGKPRVIEKYLRDNRLPEIGIQQAGWNKVVKQGGEMLETFRSWFSGTMPEPRHLGMFRSEEFSSDEGGDPTPILAPK